MNTQVSHINDIEQRLSEFKAHPLGVLLYNPEIQFFSADNAIGSLGYICHKRSYICIGSLLAEGDNKKLLLKAWLEWVKSNKGLPVFVHITMQDVELLHELDFNVNQIGASFSLDLLDYTMSGKRFQQLRNKISKAKKAGVTVRSINSPSEYEEVLPSMQKINSAWIDDKGVKELRYLVTKSSAIAIPSKQRRLFVAEKNGEVIAYVVYTKIPGEKPGWFHDLSRKIPDAPNGIMQAINAEAIKEFKLVLEDENAEVDKLYLHFGFTPLTEMHDKEDELSLLGSPVFAAITRFLTGRGGVIYPARSQRQYKMSWRPQIIDPEFLAYPKGKTLSSLWALLRATDSV